MADPLNKAASKYKKDMAALQKGASMSGSLEAPGKKAPAVEADFSKIDPTKGAYGEIDANVAKQQAANKADPSIQDKLNKVAKQRAKFYGEDK